MADGLTPWRNGPPPCVGVWETRVNGDPHGDRGYRYFDGTRLYFIGNTPRQAFARYKEKDFSWHKAGDMEYRGLSSNPEAANG